MEILPETKSLAEINASLEGVVETQRQVILSNVTDVSGEISPEDVRYQISLINGGDQVVNNDFSF